MALSISNSLFNLESEGPNCKDTKICKADNECHDEENERVIQESVRISKKSKQEHNEKGPWTLLPTKDACVSAYVEAHWDSKPLEDGGNGSTVPSLWRAGLLSNVSKAQILKQLGTEECKDKK